MKVLKITISAVLILLALFFLSAAFLPSQLQVRAVKMTTAEPNVLYRQINILKNWEPWSPFMETDPNMMMSYKGRKSGIGAICQWTSPNLGTGSMEIVETKVNEFLKFKVLFGDNTEGSMLFHIRPENDSTFVQWTFLQDLSYPLERFMGLILKGKIKEFLDDGLINLTFISEQFGDGVRIQKGNIDAVQGISMLDSASFDQLQVVQADLYQKMADYVNAQGAEINGPPYCVFYRYDPRRKIVFEVGYPVDKMLEGTESIHMVNIPSGNVVSASHFGPYTSLLNTHSKIQKYIRNNKLKWSGPPWEVYATDPATEPDTSRWETKIFYPVNQ